MAVSTLDYSHFTSGTKEQRHDFAHALLDSFERTGFAKLKGHVFNAQELKEAFTLVALTSTYTVVGVTLTFFSRVKSFSTSHWT